MSVLESNGRAQAPHGHVKRSAKPRKGLLAGLLARKVSSTRTQDVQKGASFRHQTKEGRAEIASVITLLEILGLPHVKYMLRIESPRQVPFEDGPRVMNLQSFIAHFSQPV